MALTSYQRLQNYINKKKIAGYKRVSFFVDIKLWRYITKRAKKENLSINDYLKRKFDFV